MIAYGTRRDYNESDCSPALPSRCQNGDSKTRSGRATGRRLRRLDARRARAAGKAACGEAAQEG